MYFTIETRKQENVCTSHIVTYYVNNKNRTLACAHIHAPTPCGYVILTTLFAFRAQQLFFLHHQYVYACERERKKTREIFVLLKEQGLYASDVWTFVWRHGRRKIFSTLSFSASACFLLLLTLLCCMFYQYINLQLPLHHSQWLHN